jgi:[acyl-carrier-protein] S-malonyltransferase
MKAFIFPGQGCQKEKMGKDLYDNFPKAKSIFEQANDILGERFSDFLFNASEDVLMDTRYTQLAVFIYEVAAALSQDDITPDCVAGHSLGEYAALVVAEVISFEEGVQFIKKRGQVFYDAFTTHPSAMAAIIGLSDDIVQKTIDEIGEADGENLYIANYNGPGQIVITGARNSIKKACKKFKELGAKRALLLPMKGVGHSPNSAHEGELLSIELKKMKFSPARIPVYQDADGLPHTSPEEILNNQIKLMTYPVLWTNIINNMAKNGVKEYYEVGPDDTLQKMVRRMQPDLLVDSILHTPTYNHVIQDFSIIK